MTTQIIALGGGGFSMESDNPLLDRFVLEQAQRDAPRVCFLPTASGDNDNYIRRFYDAFTRLDCRPTHLSLFRPPKSGPQAHLREQDVVYVGGGSTINMLALWRTWDLVDTLRELWQRGTVLCGISAGSLCWFDSGLSDSVVPGQYERLEGLGFLPGSHCPHYDGEAGRRPVYRQLIGRGSLPEGVAAEDGVALHYVGGVLERVVSSRPGAQAYRVVRASNASAGDGVTEEVLEVHYLGSGRGYASLPRPPKTR